MQTALRLPPTSPHQTLLPGAEVLDLLQLSATGMFPGAALEALIARLESGK